MRLATSYPSAAARTSPASSVQVHGTATHSLPQLNGLNSRRVLVFSSLHDGGQGGIVKQRAPQVLHLVRCLAAKT